jgi:predicted alpha-1,6-mannanase (GH76 family)
MNDNQDIEKAITAVGYCAALPAPGVQRRAFLGGVAAAAATMAMPAGGVARLSPAARARLAFDAFVRAYWVEEKAYFRRHKGKDKPLDFWFSAHAWDMLIDADRLFRTARTKTMVRRFYDAFMRRHPDWRKNEFNDDILWWTIACTNAFVHTHERRYLQQARSLFDHLAAREIDSTLGGGIWWKSSEHKSKNACANFPAVITACNLNVLTHERTYLDTARSLYDWGREKFFDAKTGAVYDNVNLKGRLTRWDFTYNVGTFIGSALRLHRATRAKKFIDDAMLAARHFMTALSRNGIVKPCGKGDGGAFHGVGFRYMAELARRSTDPEVRAYIMRNAESAWTNRRASDDLVGEDWMRPPREDFDVEGQVANSALTAIILAARLQ